MPKQVVVLGATGSVGTSTLAVIQHLSDQFVLLGISIHTNTEGLFHILAEHHPKYVCITDEATYQRERGTWDFPATLLSGEEGMKILVSLPETDIVVNALVGYSGFVPTMTAIHHHKRIALANKETMVVGGSLINKALAEHQAQLIPVDSELSALMFLLESKPHQVVEQVTLTASGGALRDVPIETLHRVTAHDVLNHPTWSMGAKITIDCATMINKGFEVIEAHHFFHLPYEKIRAVIHRESVIHGLVETVDGEWYAQLGATDMKIPIQNALTYPALSPSPIPRLDITRINALHFAAIDPVRYPLFELVYQVGKAGGSLPIVLNRSNEEAVHAFLTGRIGFMDIPKVIEKMLSKHDPVANPTYSDLVEMDAMIKRRCKELLPTYTQVFLNPK